MTVRSNSPYTPVYMKRALADSKPARLSYSQIKDIPASKDSELSFRYDPLDYPLKSTQQLKVDWSKFENHTFFSSAEVKVNDAFNKLINGYPFDGTKVEVQQFMDSLSGFEKWVFDQFPKWSGSLHFSGTQVGEDPSNGFPAGLGTWISVKDASGNLYPELAKNNEGNPVLNPGSEDSMSIEMLLKLPEIVNDHQVILQKISSEDMGFTLHLEQSPSTQYVSGVFSICSGSVKNNVAALLEKGKYNHICAVLNRDGTSSNKLQFFVNESLEKESSLEKSFDKMNIDYSNLIIGSGSSFYSSNILVTPAQTLSGTIDELRIFHSARGSQLQQLYANRGLYASSDLKLYYRFNEPTGSLSLNGNPSIDSLVLDSSGNSLHSNIENFDSSLRINESSNDVMKNEIDEFNIILFPAHQSVIDLNLSLLQKANDYDRNNPNIIVKLIPKHYLLEGAAQDGFSNIKGRSGEPYTGEGIPGQGVKESTQLVLSFLYIWSKFFDEIKTYIDSFGTLQTLKYENEYDTVPDNFLEDMIRNSGFYLPKFFSNSTSEQYSEGAFVEGLTDGNITLKQIQSILTRRTLVNLKDIVSSKGTQHSVRAFLRSIGVDPDNSLRIREYGGPTTKQLISARDKRTESLAMVQFSPTSFVASSPLVASRIEPGYPTPAGTFYSDPITNEVLGTTDSNDNLLTSGSWNVECIFKIPPNKLESIVDENGNQSLMRLITTGSSISVDPGLVVNVVATQFIEHPETSATVQAFIRAGTETSIVSSPVLSLSLQLKGKGIFDGEKWNVAIGCRRNDEIGSIVSSSYYLRAGKADQDNEIEYYTTSSFFQETLSGDNVFRQLSSLYNSSGSYICLGPAQTISTTLVPNHRFLNSYLLDDIMRTTDYVGWASNLRVWSKSMSLDEWKEHVRNPKSIGVQEPKKNYNFVNRVSGSFQKLRMESLIKQPIRTSDTSGVIKFLDFSLNFDEAATGTGFGSEEKVLVGDIFSYSYISPAFDDATTNDKIRVRSFENQQLLEENPFSVPTPSYLSEEYFASEELQDDLRFSIEFSMMDALDRDIINMFSSLDTFNDALGRPELMFSPDYPDLEVMRDVYFNRLSEKPNYRKFLEFYRWFDISISTFIEQLLPSKTLYKGTNYVIESHMLERHKHSYKHSDNYIGQKNVIQDSLLVQQIVGRFRKY